MTEQTFVRDYLRTLRAALPHAVVLKHPGTAFSKGVPDMSLTLNGRTSWWEFKYTIDARIRNHADFGLQLVMCLALAAAGTCYYVVLSDDNDERRIHIVEPRAIDRETRRYTGIDGGADYAWLVKRMAKEHER